MSKQHEHPRPVAMCFSGHDPVGGAGIQADIEAIAANGVHASTLITALTVQDTHNVERVEPIESTTLLDAALAVLDDLDVAAFKIGLLGSVDNVLAIAGLLREHPDLPVVLDPVLAAGGGSELAGSKLVTAIREQLLPHCTVVTPNTHELLRLAGNDDPATAVATLHDCGCPYVLVTGSHADTPNVINTLYGDGEPTRYEVERLPGSYHGSGCTLAASLAAQLARGHDVPGATKLALDYTYAALRDGFQPGSGQAIPTRVVREEKA